MPIDSLDIQTLSHAYASGRVTPSDVVRAVYSRIAAGTRKNVWIQLVPLAEALGRAEELEQLRAIGSVDHLPLFGIPFAIKDNIDLAGLPTTAACPEYAYTPERSAYAVEKLIAAGAIPIGKTNLDQFATGLVGVRSPYGACKNAFDPNYISGGSSSGSAVAVALGEVSFSLGTDTAGSGRVPAAFNNLVGLKPTKGAISTRGVVPACRSLDCVSIFALTTDDAVRVYEVARGFDDGAIYSRPETGIVPVKCSARPSFRFGVPMPSQLQAFGRPDYGALFERAVQRLIATGGVKVEIDFTPFRAAADLLYEGPWVAERYAELSEFMAEHPDTIYPVTKAIVSKGKSLTAVDVFKAQYKLEECRQRAQREWKKMDVLLTPTASALYTLAEVEADPIALNTRLGYYTNYVNLLDGCALALPAGFDTRALPFGITLIAPAFRDGLLAALGARFHRDLGGLIGATETTLASIEASSSAQKEPVTMELKSELKKTVRLAVVGAHLRGQPLNKQLTDLDARFAEACKTAPKYKLYALEGTVPPKPGLEFVAEGGASIEVEVWELGVEQFGAFVAAVPPPMAIGTLHLESGEAVKGFLCEPFALKTGRDISSFGGWRNYLASLKK